MPGGEVHWRAFVPDKTHNETSVFNVSGLREEQIWDIATEHRPSTIARGDVAIEKAIIPPLELVVAEPPPRHMAIRGWPEKQIAKELQMQLAANSVLMLRPVSQG